MKWSIPKKTTMLDISFGTNNIGNFLPNWNEIPEEYKCRSHAMAILVRRWFFNGLPKSSIFTPRKGVDKLKALAHIKVCMLSWDPSHEHKEAGCAYLLDLFFKQISISENE